jgi:hypothetical protein
LRSRSSSASRHGRGGADQDAEAGDGDEDQPGALVGGGGRRRDAARLPIGEVDIAVDHLLKGVRGGAARQDGGDDPVAIGVAGDCRTLDLGDLHRVTELVDVVPVLRLDLIEELGLFLGGGRPCLGQPFLEPLPVAGDDFLDLGQRRCGGIGGNPVLGPTQGDHHSAELRTDGRLPAGDLEFVARRVEGAERVDAEEGHSGGDGAEKGDDRNDLRRGSIRPQREEAWHGACSLIVGNPPRPLRSR